MVVDLLIQDVRDHSVTDSHLQVGPDLASGEDRSMLRLQRPDLDLGIGCLQGLADAGNGSPGSNAGTESMDRLARLLQDLSSGLLSMCGAVGFIGKLLGHIHIGIFCRHLGSQFHTSGDAGADISVVMNQDHFRSVAFHQFSPLLADGIRHDDLCLISFHRSDQGKADALIATGGFYNDCSRMDQPFFFRRLDHLLGCSGLDRSSDIDCFKFYQDLCVFWPCHLVQTDQRSIPHCVKHVIIDHVYTLLCLNLRNQKISILLIIVS